MIKQKIDIITQHFTTETTIDIRQDSISLLSGKSGTVIYLTELYKNTGDVFFKQEIERSLELLFSKIDQTENLLCTYCDGIAGWGWMIEYLKQEKIIGDTYDAVLNDLDEILDDQIDKLMEQYNLDLLHGMLGLGIYFIKRKNREKSEKILNHIVNYCSVTDDELRFIRRDIVRIKEDIYDLGLPHGMVGVLYYLIKCYQLNVRPEECMDLLTKGINLFLNNIQDPIVSGSYFPNSFIKESYRPGMNPPSLSRMAWCYGDLTILYAIFKASRVLRNPQMEKSILDKLKSLCLRRQPSETIVSDASFCHGTSGIAYFFLKLYKYTGLDEFNSSAKFWIDQTIAYGQNEGYAGYLFGVGNFEKIVMAPSSGILEGIGGVGLALLSFEYQDSQNSWDECLFLS